VLSHRLLDSRVISRVDRTSTSVLMLLMVGTYIVVGVTVGLLIGQSPFFVVLAVIATGWFPLFSLVVNRRRAARRKVDNLPTTHDWRSPQRAPKT
jgi:hypothetical protein